MILGNSIIHKHAQSTPLCAIALHELFEEAGFDRGEYQSVFLDENQVAYLLKSRYIRGCRFLGSLKTGKLIAGLAGENMKKATFELGGNDPFIVMRDANVDKAAEAAYISRLRCNG